MEANKRKKIVVVSNGPEQFGSAVAQLAGEGFWFHFARDINYSFCLANDEPPDLIISELAVPDVDGLQLCKRVREESALAKVPILLVGDLSRHSEIVEDGFRCGAVDYVQKPIDGSDLAEKCRAIMTDRNEPSSVAIPPDHRRRSPPRELAPPRNVVPFDRLFANKLLRNTIFDNAAIGLALFSSTGQFIEANKILLQMLDHSEQGFQGMSVWDFVFTVDIDLDEHAVEEVLAGKREHCQLLNGYVTPSGEAVWGMLTIASIPALDEGANYYLGIFEDPLSPSSDPSEPKSARRRRLNIKKIEHALEFARWEIDQDLICEN